MPRAARQPYFSSEFKPRYLHGGGINAGKRKTSRPIDPKKPMHITMRALQARGNLNLLRPANKRVVDRIVAEMAKRFHIEIIRWANVGNHIHLLVRARTRKGFQNFLRVTAGQIGQLVTGAKKGKPFGKRFWDVLAFSRVVIGWRGFKIAENYVFENEMEALGIPAYKSSEFTKDRRRISFYSAAQ